MTGKAKSKNGAATKKCLNTLTIPASPGKTQERLLAEIGFSSALGNASTARTFAKHVAGDLSINDAVAVLLEKSKRVQDGDLAEVEAKLMAQAVALDAIFNGLANRAALNMGEYLNASETYIGNAGGSEMPPACGFREAGQYRARAATGEQRDSRRFRFFSVSCARGRTSNPAKQTIGG